MIPTLRPPIFASVSRPENAQACSRPLSLPRSLDPSIPAAQACSRPLSPPRSLDPSIPAAQACSRPLSLPRSLDPSIPAALVRAPGDCRPNGYYDWTPGGEGGSPPRRDPPEHHGPRRLHASLIVLGVTVTVYLILFTAGMAWVCVFGK